MMRTTKTDGSGFALREAQDEALVLSLSKYEGRGSMSSVMGSFV